MNKTEHLLTCLIEECAEIQHAATKALRFGINDDYKESTPAQDIERECYDLVAILELLAEEGLISSLDNLSAITKKKMKIAEYMEYARERNTLI